MNLSASVRLVMVGAILGTAGTVAGCGGSSKQATVDASADVAKEGGASTGSGGAAGSDGGPPDGVSDAAAGGHAGNTGGGGNGAAGGGHSGGAGGNGATGGGAGGSGAGGAAHSGGSGGGGAGGTGHSGGAGGAGQGGIGGAGSLCSSPPPTGCCTSATDCGSGSNCVGLQCSDPGAKAGVCKAKTTAVGLGVCWDDLDCPQATFHCVAARICPCGAACLLADALGNCALRN